MLYDLIPNFQISLAQRCKDQQGCLSSLVIVIIIIVTGYIHIKYNVMNDIINTYLSKGTHY